MLVRAAAFSAPAVLVECGGVSDRAEQKVPVVVIETPAARSEGSGFLSEESRGRKVEVPEMHTELNAGIYPGCVLEARLSVIRPDNLLDRVILDPKADFWVYSKNAQPGIARNPGFPDFRACSGVPECDVSFAAENRIKDSKELRVVVSFTPASGERLSPSSVSLSISPDELRAYCP